MQKTKFLIIAVIMVLAMVFPVFADEFELGMSLTPIVQENDTEDPNYNEDQDLVLPGFHVGYRFAWIGFVSWDSYVMPPEYVTLMTGTYDPDTDTDTFSPGPFRPGFLNTWNIGAKLVLGPLVGYTTVGVNSIYVYKQDEYLDENFNSNFGANWKVGAGWKFGGWGINNEVYRGTDNFTISSTAVCVINPHSTSL